MYRSMFVQDSAELECLDRLDWDSISPICHFVKYQFWITLSSYTIQFIAHLITFILHPVTITSSSKSRPLLTRNQKEIKIQYIYSYFNDDKCNRIVANY